MAKVYHAEIFGLRETKYHWLNKNDIKKVKWKKCAPIPDFYLFIPTDNKMLNHYSEFPKITDIFPVNSVGIVTARDNFVIDFDKKKLERRIVDFRNPNIDDEIIKQSYGLTENLSWKIRQQREKLRKDLDWKDSITKILYRPFDERWILYHDDMIERSRRDVMSQMLEENIGLIARRQMLPNKPMNYFFVSNNLIADGVIRSDNKGSESIFPLYIYLKSSSKKKAKFSQLFIFEPEEEYQAILPNISKDLIASLVRTYKKSFLNPLEGLESETKKVGFGSKNIFYYIYAVLYSNTYRTKYSEFLKIDFPRIPFTSNYKLFIQLGKLGKQLADLHLLKSNELDKPISMYSGKGDYKVTIRPKWDNEKVYINATRYFTNVKEEVWNYQIGGYQVCDKWLKDRKDRELSLDEIETYCKIVTALSKTIELQKEIDENYKGVEK